MEPNRRTISGQIQGVIPLLVLSSEAGLSAGSSLFLDLLLERRAETLPVVELDPGPDACPGLPDRLVRIQVDLFLLQAPPQPFHEHIVHEPAPAVHADSDAGILQDAREVLTGALASLALAPRS